MANVALVELALKALSCTQKQLALKLSVSETQISKWKKGEHMSSEMEKKLCEIAGVGDMEPEFVVWAGSCEEVEKWEKLIHFLAEQAEDSAETGYDTYPLQDDMGLLCWQTLGVLRDMGVDLPHQVPDEIAFEYDLIYDEKTSGRKSEKLHSILFETNPYSKLIYELYLALNNVCGFHSAFIQDLMDDDDLDLISTDAQNIEFCLIDLAACKLEEDPALMPRFKEFRHKTLEMFEGWINTVKGKAFRAGVPLRAELLDLVAKDHDELGQQAEAESLGLNARNVHPDIYMNEILCGLRTLHQVLPAILKKLDIDFQLDRSEFYIN